MIEQLQR